MSPAARLMSGIILIIVPSIVSPLEPATPALSNKTTGRFAANPSVTAGSQ